MRDIEITDPITKAQAEGIACPHCGSKSGHYGICPTINRAITPTSNECCGYVVPFHALSCDQVKL